MVLKFSLHFVTIYTKKVSINLCLYKSLFFIILIVFKFTDYYA